MGDVRQMVETGGAMWSLASALIAVAAAAAPPSDIPVAVVQYTPFVDPALSPAQNLAAHARDILDWTAKAWSANGARLAVFPELSLGYNCGSGRNGTAQFALRLPGAALWAVCRLSCYGLSPPFGSQNPARRCPVAIRSTTTRRCCSSCHVACGETQSPPSSSARWRL